MKILTNKKFLAVLGQTLFGLILLFVWSRFIDLGGLLEYFQAIKVQFLLVALVFAFSGTFLRVFRWKILLRPIKEVPFIQLLLISFAGSFINFLVPIRIGEFSKAYFLKKRYNLPIARLIPSILVDRGLDFFTLVSFFIILPTVFLSLPDDRIVSTWWALIFLAIPAGVFYILVWRQRVGLVFIDFFKKFLPVALGERLKRVATNFLEGFLVLKRKPILLATLIAFSIVALLVDATFFYFLFLAFGFKSAILPIILATILMTLSFIIPSAPGFIGTTEVAGSLVFSVILGIETNFAASVTVFYHLLTAAMLLIVGAIALEILQFNIIGVLRRALVSGNNN